MQHVISAVVGLLGLPQAVGKRRGLQAAAPLLRLRLQLLFTSLLLTSLVPGALSNAQAARVAAVSPQGEVPEVRQVSLRFDAAVVTAGDPRQPAPATLMCQSGAGPAGAPAGDARWASDRLWLIDLATALPAASRCTLRLRDDFQGLGGAIDGVREWRFNSGAPQPLSVQPSPGSSIEEDQHFLLRLSGAVDPASVRAHVWCEVEGLGERSPVRLVDGPARELLLRQRQPGVDPATLLLLACQRPFPAEAGVRLVWGAGVTAAGWAASQAAGRSTSPSAVVSRIERRFAWKVRPRFAAEFSCERENANAPCMPLRPITLRFNAPVPRALALAARLVPQTATGGVSGTSAATALAPQIDATERSELLSEVRFAAPLPENTRFMLTVPAELRDDSGRALANSSSFPLPVATAGMPPLAKFAGAPFGILEAGRDAAEPALLPLTLRHVQADWAGATAAGRIRVKTLDSNTSDVTLLRWIGRLRQYHESQLSAREAGRPAAEWTVLETQTDAKGRSRPVRVDRVLATRELSLLTQEPDARVQALPTPAPSSGRSASATEVLGLPLARSGYHVVEVESQVLGSALLASRAPMFVRTGALVTNLAVHFKRGRTSSLVWVTALDRGRPVPNAKVVVNDCRGQALWNGSTDAQGIARIERGFDEPPDVVKGEKCLSDDGFFVTARSGGDLSFVFSRWQRGIEPWRFNLPLADMATPLSAPTRHAHSVFDRSLLRPGETLSMKHFVRDDSERGLTLPGAASLPTEVLITHVGSGAETVLALNWKQNARSAHSQWPIPPNAALGSYDVALRRGDQRLASGSVRVEAFRVPLVDARLTGPSGVLVAATELAFSAQLNALAGGPMRAAPLQLSALLRPFLPQFSGLEDYSFQPPGRAQTEAQSADEQEPDGSQIVADKLPGRTDANGAASFSLKALPKLSSPSELLAELSFNDPAGEVQTVSQRLRLWPANVVVGLRVPGWAAARGRAQFSAVVLATDGRPLKGRLVQVLGRLHSTLSTRKRIVGGFYSYDNQRLTRELGVLCSGTSDAQGRLMCDAKINAVGEVELLARAADDAGRVAEAASSAWVTGSGEQWFAQDNDDRIDLLPEKRDVEPGQTARLQVRMPFAQATALVTIEREGVIDARVVQLSGREPVIEVRVPALAPQRDDSANELAMHASKDRALQPVPKSWAPNVTVSVLVLRGRLRQAPWWSAFTWGWREPAEWWRAFRFEDGPWRAPTALVDLAKPSFKIGVAALNVGLAAQRLDVVVSTDKPLYGVRETVKTKIRVSQAGQPVAGAEVAFAAVDEGLLALQPNHSWDLLQALLQPRPWGVETASAQSEIIGRRHYGRKALAPGGGGGRNPSRELFDTLLLWRGTVLLNSQGEATIDVPLNDSLSSFKLVAIADAGGVAGGQRFGTGSTSIRVSQDLQMLSGLAALAREGDRFDAAFTLRNTTKRPMNLTATLVGQPVGEVNSASGTVTALAFGSQSLTLAAGASQELTWPVEVPSGATRIDWLAEVTQTAAEGSAKDRLKIVQNIAPAVPLRVWQASLLNVPSQGSAPLLLPFAPPAGALPVTGVPSGGIQATWLASLAGASPGLRRYFETYPYTCLEQKTSRAIALRDAAAWGVLTAELPGYLDADGLAHFFPPSAGSAPRGSDRLTAHLIASADEAGWAWPAASLQTMLRGLTAFVEGRIERDFNAPQADREVRKLAALEALSRHGRALPRMLASINFSAPAMALWSTSALLDAWGLLRRIDGAPERSARLAEVQRLLRARLIEGGTTLSFSTEARDDWWWLMDGPDSNAVRLLLAATDAPGWKDDAPKLLSGALARQRAGAWRTTTANLWGALALERFAQRFEAVPVAGRSTLMWAGRSVSHDWQSPPAPGSTRLPWSSAVAGAVAGAASASSILQAQHSGAGRPWLSLQSLAAVPLQAPLAAGYRIVRTVTTVDGPGKTPWRRGDVQRVRLEIDAVADGAWVVLSDPVPAGATILGSGLGRDASLATRGENQAPRSVSPSYIERTPAAWRGYFEWLPRGRHVVEYSLRLNASGRFGLPPTRVEAMYAPDSFGEVPNAALEVQP